MGNIFRSQSGVAMLMVISFMALSVPMITGALVLAGTLSKDSQVKTEILKRQYSALGCDEYAVHLIKENLPSGTYPCVINGDPADIVIGGVPPLAAPPFPADDSRRLYTQKTVSPTTAFADTLTTFTYDITVGNADDEPENLEKIHDILPAGFSYVPGSTSGITTNDPSIDGQKLTWDLAYLTLVLDSGDTIDLTFNAEAEVPDGNYCNEAWVEPGNEKTGTRLSAMVQVGSPANDLCPGAAVRLTKSVEVERGVFNITTPLTYTYTITIENHGTSDLTLSQVRDLLPVDFFYLNGTTTGSLTTSDPTAVLWNGMQRLDWAFTTPKTILSGQTETLTFDMEGAFTGGHWNQVWLTLGEFTYTVYSWPTAGVEVIEGTESTTTMSDGTTVYTLIWKIASDTFIKWEWSFE